jgi:hypothetical protein
MANVVHVGDIGTIIRFTVKDDGVIVNLSSATTITFYLMDPGGNVANKTGTLTTDGTDGKIEYTTTTGVIDEAGTWTIQAKVAQSATPVLYTSKVELEVLGVLA